MNDSIKLMGRIEAGAADGVLGYAKDILDESNNQSVQETLDELRLAAETDPVFSSSAAANITTQDITNWNGKSSFSGSYNDLADKPTGLATETFVTNAIANAQLSGGDVDLSGFATKIDLSGKVDKIEGKGLSTNDFTSADKTKLANAITTELDPVFSASPAYNITQQDILRWNGKSNFSGSYNDLTNKPTIPSIDGLLSSSDAAAIYQPKGNYLTSFTESDPVFTASPAYNITQQNIIAWNGKSDFSGSYNDLTDKPTIPNTDNFITTETDPVFSASPAHDITSSDISNWNNKVDSVSGKGLSTNDYTTTEKTKLEGIESGAQVNVQSDWNQTNSSADDYIKNKPIIPDIDELVSIAEEYFQPKGDYLTSFTESDPIFTASAAHSITQQDITNWNGKSNFSGSYNDLTDKPTIPSAEELLTAETDPVFTASPAYNITQQNITAWNGKSDFSGSYNDLTDKPTGLATETFVTNAIANAQLGGEGSEIDLSGYATKDDLNGKVDKISGKSLSTNDYTTAEKTKLEGIESGAQVNTITGIKGNAESSYRTGNVNLTPANIGALAASDISSWALSSTKPTYTASEVGALPDSTIIPTNTSDLLNDSGFIDTETDPVFTASPAYNITQQNITAWNGKSDFSGSYNDLTDKPTIPTVPTNVSDFTNDAGYLTSFTESDPVFTASAAHGITYSDISNWNNKVDSVSGKGLSTNDYTTAEKTKLEGIESGAQVNVQSDWNQTNSSADDYIKNKPTIPTIPTNVSEFTNDAGYLTSHQSLSNYFTKSEVNNLLDEKIDDDSIILDSNNKYTLSDSVKSSLSLADTALQSHQDISGLASISDLTTHTSNTTIHVTSAEKTAWNNKSDFSGSYNDLTDKPTIPNTDNFITAETDPVFTASAAYGITSSDISNWNNKVDSVSGKGLSTNDYTTTEKTKLEGIESGAQVNVQSDWNQTNSSADDYIKNKPIIPSISGLLKSSDAAELYQPKGDYLTSFTESDPVFTSSAAYSITSSDISNWNSKVDSVSGKGLSTNDYTTTEKTKLEGIESGAQVNDIESIQVGGVTVGVTNKVATIATVTPYDPDSNPLATLVDLQSSGASNLTLGETATTAYRGDRGKIAYDHSQLTSGNPHNVSKTDVGLGNVDNTSDLNKPISAAVQAALDDKASTSSVTSAITSAINALDVSDSEESGKFVTSVSETDGEISISKKYIKDVLQTSTQDITDNTDLVTSGDAGYSSQSPHSYSRKASYLWNYIVSKISSVLGLTASNYGGTASKATSDASGNNIESTYATSTSLTSHTSDNNIHVTASDKTNWNSKADGTHTHAISDVTNLQSTLTGKQDSLTVGRGLDITSNVISTPKAVLQNEIVHTDSTPSYTSSKTTSPYYHQILSIPASSFSLVMNVTGNTLGFPYNTTLYITSTNYQYSLVSLFKLGFVLAIDNDNDLIYLCNNKLKTHSSTPGRLYSFQIVEYTGSESIIWAEESTILDTTGMTIEEEMYVKVEQLSTDTVTFNVNSNPATWVTSNSKLNYMGNISTNSVEDLVLHCHNNLNANSQIKLVFTKDITNSLTIKNSNGTTTFCTIDSPIYAGSIVNLTAVSDTTDGWLASVDSAALYSSDHSVVLTQYNSKTDITLPSTVIRNHYYNPEAEANGMPNDNQLAIGNGTTTVYQAVAMGYHASAVGIDSVAIGYIPKSSYNSVCIGYNASDVQVDRLDTGEYEYESGVGQNVAIGQFAQLTPTSGRAISIGADSKVGYKLGNPTSDTENDHGWASIAIGAGAEAHNSYCTAIGFEAEAKGYDDIAIGDSAIANSGLYDSNATYDDGKNGHSIAIGRSTTARGQQTVIGSLNEGNNDNNLFVLADGHYDSEQDQIIRHDYLTITRDYQISLGNKYARFIPNYCLVINISYNSSTLDYDFDFNEMGIVDISALEEELGTYGNSISYADTVLDANTGYNSAAVMNVRYYGMSWIMGGETTVYAINSRKFKIISNVTFYSSDGYSQNDIRHDYRVTISFDDTQTSGNKITISPEDITDWYGTQAEYEALTSITEGRNYFIINS